MTASKIVKVTNWQKQWVVSNYTLLSCSLMNNGYDAACRKRYGKGLTHNFYVLQDNGITCYQSASENKILGSLIGQLFSSKPDLVLQNSKEIRHRTERLQSFMRRSVTQLLNKRKLEEFKKLYTEYMPAFLAASRSGEYITGKSTDRTLLHLERTRNYSSRLYVATDNYLKKLTAVIAKRDNIKNYDLTTLTFEELEHYLATKRLSGAVSLKRRFSVAGLYYNEGKSLILNKSEVTKFEREILKTHKLSKGLIKGQAIYAGKVSGRVKIVSRVSQIKNFLKGDILVTGMTRPEFLPLMKRAAAIVTDAGGLLSHAAISARELKKPCIVGTQTATISFKNGDLVEVDANKGIIRKIQKSLDNSHPLYIL